MHHKRFVKALVVNRVAPVTNVYHRCLGKSCEQLMRRLRCKHGRPFAVVVFRIATHRKTPLVHRIKTRISVPGFVKMQPVDTFSQQLLDPVDIITQAVIR